VNTPLETRQKVRIEALETRNAALRLHIDKLEEELRQAKAMVSKLLRELSSTSDPT